MNALAGLYEQDWYAWTLKNAELLRQGYLGEVDREHLAEQLESMGRGQQHGPAFEYVVPRASKRRRTVAGRATDPQAGAGNGGTVTR